MDGALDDTPAGWEPRMVTVTLTLVGDQVPEALAALHGERRGSGTRRRVWFVEWPTVRRAPGLLPRGVVVRLLEHDPDWAGTRRTAGPDTCTVLWWSSGAAGRIPPGPRHPPPRRHRRCVSGAWTPWQALTVVTLARPLAVPIAAGSARGDGSPVTRRIRWLSPAQHRLLATAAPDPGRPGHGQVLGPAIRERLPVSVGRLAAVLDIWAAADRSPEALQLSIATDRDEAPLARLAFLAGIRRLGLDPELAYPFAPGAMGRLVSVLADRRRA